MAKLKMQAVPSYANVASLPTPVGGIYELAITTDTATLYQSDGSSWTVAGSSGNIDGGNATSVYGGSNLIDGGGA